MDQKIKVRLGKNEAVITLASFLEALKQFNVPHVEDSHGDILFVQLDNVTLEVELIGAA